MYMYMYSMKTRQELTQTRPHILAMGKLHRATITSAVDCFCYNSSPTSRSPPPASLTTEAVAVAFR